MPFIDARDLPGGSELMADLIVIGAGMAGIAIARAWAGWGLGHRGWRLSDTEGRLFALAALSA